MSEPPPTAGTPRTSVAGNPRLIFNNRLDAVVTGILIALVSLLLIESVRQWIGLLSGKRVAKTAEAPFVLTQLTEERV